MTGFKQDILNLARIKFGEIPKDVEHRLIAETDAIKDYGRGEMLHTMWRLVEELKKHDINICLTLGQGYNVSLVCYLLGISSFNPIDHPGIKTESYAIGAFKISSEIVFKIDKDQSAVIDGFLNSLRYEVARMDVSGDFHSRQIKAGCEGNSDFAFEFKYEPNIGRTRIFGELIGWDKFEKIPTDDVETMKLIHDIDIYGATTSSLAPITIEAIREIKPSNVEKLADALSFTSERKYSHLLKYLENRDTGNRVFTGHPKIDEILSPTHGVLLNTSQLVQIFKMPLRSELGETAYKVIRGKRRSLMASPIVDRCDIYVKAYDLYRSAYVKVHYPEIFKKVIESNSNSSNMSAISDYIKFLNNRLMKVDITNLYQDDTGIEGMIMISRKYPGQKIPCLRYYVQDIAMSVSIEDNPKAMLPKSIDGSVSTKYEGIVSWIILNRPILLEYWNNAEYPTNCLLNSLKKLNELNEDEIEELRPFDSTSYAMRRIGLPYVMWVYTYKTESSPIVKITKPSSKSHIIVSLQGDPEIIEGKGLESFDDDIDNIENWIRQNRDNLLAYWTHEIDSVDLSERLYDKDIMKFMYL